MNWKNISKYGGTAVFLIYSTTVSWAQDAAEQTGAPATAGADWTYENFLLILGGIVVAGALWSLYYLNTSLMELQKIRLLQEHGREVLEKADLMPQGESFWSSLYKRMTNVVPVAKEKDILLDHDYDGIHELDNSLPPWWLYMFYISIVFGVIYMGYFHFSDNASGQLDWYEQEMEVAQAKVDRYLATQADQIDENNVMALVDDTDLSVGQTIYNANCVACHGAEGQGGVGPNMTDKYWIHGGSMSDVFKVIKYGVPEKGMIAWKAQLSSSDMQKVASYIFTFQGTNPPGAKEPQGELYEPEKKNVETEESEETEETETEMGDQLGMLEAE